MLFKFKIFIFLLIVENVIINVISDKVSKKCLNLLNSTISRHENTIENDGFHKMFAFNIELSTDIKTFLNSECNLMIAQHFNSNFYVDEFELKQSIYKQLFSFFLSEKVNTESIEYRSEQFMLFLFINKSLISCDDLSKKCMVNFSYPFHLRYHAPSSNYLYLHFKLLYPRVLVANCNQDQINEDQLNKAFKKIDKEIIKDFVVGNCFLNEMEYDYSKNEIEISVPVGQAEYENTVMVITLVFLILLALFVSKLFREKSLEFKKKAN